MIQLTILTLMSVFIFPIVAFLSMFMIGPLGVLSAWFSILQMSHSVTMFVMIITYLPKIQGAVFDSILSSEGQYDLVQRYKTGQVQAKRKKCVRFTQAVKFRLWPCLGRELTFCVVVLVPFLGPLIVMYLKAPIKAYRTHKRYYRLMGWDHEQVAVKYRQFKADYTAFGFVALVLELTPGLAVFFMFTSNIGLALWSVEKHAMLQQ